MINFPEISSFISTKPPLAGRHTGPGDTDHQAISRRKIERKYL
jgi:hypothetical protein